MSRYARLAFTDPVRQVQREEGSWAHVTQRFSLDELPDVRAEILAVRRENQELARENAELRTRLAGPGAPGRNPG
jgi:hypothetical protein